MVPLPYGTLVLALYLNMEKASKNLNKSQPNYGSGIPDWYIFVCIFFTNHKYASTENHQGPGIIK